MLLVICWFFIVLGGSYVTINDGKEDTSKQDFSRELSYGHSEKLSSGEKLQQNSRENMTNGVFLSVFGDNTRADSLLK